eukprot:Seg65.3 transcript_id=Seg65.3/GoldUCD/mRNA.D3Y31 product="Cellular tumor antigen p53" protein_id=Seg65.3/GoldUCD/D3Y31
MKRTSSQETEAPLSQETYELLVRGLHEAETNDGGDLLFQEEKQVLPQNGNFVNYGLPPCADSLLPQRINCAAANMAVTSLPGKPSAAPYPGEHNFRIGFEPTLGPIQKSIPSTYSEQLNQLFCNVDTLVPVKFFYNMEKLPPNSYIRGILVGKRDDFVVKTCAKHAEERKEKGHPNYHHMVQVKSQNALYGLCANTGIYFVQIPLLPRQAGIDYALEMFRFSCYNSDLKSKVDLQVVFTLEHSGTVIGRQAVGLRVCACPGRDRKSYEKRMLRRENSLLKSKHPSSDENISKRKRAKVQDDEKIYTLCYRDKKRFDQIKHISEALDACESKDTMSNLPTGIIKPTERTESGGVTKWVLENAELVSTVKTYPDRKPTAVKHE